MQSPYDSYLFSAAKIDFVILNSYPKSNRIVQANIKIRKFANFIRIISYICSTKLRTDDEY